jgi:quinol monooxygenase YgiN
MTVVVLIQLQFKPDRLEDARRVLGAAFPATRGFEGNLGCDVLVDEDDEAHWTLVVKWQSNANDEAYSQFRAGAGMVTELPDLLAAAPARVRYAVADI